MLEFILGYQIKILALNNLYKDSQINTMISYLIMHLFSYNLQIKLIKHILL